MQQRFVSLWFRYLKTDWFTLRQPRLKDMPFVLALPVHGRMVITAANRLAEKGGVAVGMVVADARSILSGLEVLDDRPELGDKLLKGIAEWCIRYTPIAAVDSPDGIVLDASGCAYLWGGEQAYVNDLVERLGKKGYQLCAAMADTVGSAWAFARYSVDLNQQATASKHTASIVSDAVTLQHTTPARDAVHPGAIVIRPREHLNALLPLPPAALRIDATVQERLYKLGLRDIQSFAALPRTSLRKRFGPQTLLRLDQAFGREQEFITPVISPELYQERLPCLEPIVTAKGIEMALENLLAMMCNRLTHEEKGLRIAQLKCYCVDGRVETVGVQTNRPSHNAKHIFKLFEDKIRSIRPDLGIELFVLEAPQVEEVSHVQDAIWRQDNSLQDTALAELLDRLAGRLGAAQIKRFLPAEHYWPERAVKPATSFHEEPDIPWRLDRPRPILLLPQPELIVVAAPIPDYPPMNFRYKGVLHTIKRADGPERIEQEWWLQQGQHRDYYTVEDELGRRYWLFRLGHYDEERTFQWFIHGFFA
ncbi:DNA polymerase Y family protein [Chitinophaga horti]|uniref:DNA polymerase Y family protein n=1 Tax=Chitinophaga horti TaxID=2920382 RepID=A0ABY6IUX6_9BACT|nr:DNA polymerase Y family protein [Chitinophaga horti]UYQ91173.1 DNA polymerase Y family protein [Chitinophaga horti]